MLFTSDDRYIIHLNGTFVFFNKSRIIKQAIVRFEILYP